MKEGEMSGHRGKMEKQRRKRGHVTGREEKGERRNKAVEGDTRGNKPWALSCSSRPG
jgi:hypothetical protein